MNIYEKIQACRDGIKDSNLEKKGHNNYSDYDYYTPEQVDLLVNEGCKANGLFHKFELKRNEHGLCGVLNIISIEDPKDRVEFVAATEMPSITATNASQQMGGCMTFSERYLKQAAFNIIDNNLDFDSQDNRKKAPASKKPPVKGKPEDDNKPWLNEKTKEFDQAKQAISEGLRTIKDVRKKFKVSKKIEALIAPASEPEIVNPDDLIPQDDDLPWEQ
jgi:hypothetical protein